MDRTHWEPTLRPIGAGLVVLLTLLLLLGTAIRDPRPHDIPVGIAAPPPVAQQLTGAFAQNAPGAFAFTTYPDEVAARAAIGRRDIVGSLVVDQAGPRLIVAGAAGDAVSGGLTAAFTTAFRAQGTELAVEVVHPFPAGDPHGILLFFLVLATLVASVIAGALSVLAMPGTAWLTRTAVLATFAVSAGIVGPATIVWLAGGLGDGIWAAMGLVALLAFAVAASIAACARLMGAAGVALGALVIVLLGLVSSGGPLGRAFLPDAYRVIAPWLPVDPALDALRGALFFGGAGATTPIVVLATWALVAVAVLAARDVGRSPETRAVAAHA